jgi:hypothetical protein
MVHDSSTLTGTRLLLSALALIVSIRPQLTQVLVPSDSAICHSIHLFKELQTTNIHGEPYSLMKMEHLQERVLAHGLLLTTHITTKPNVRSMNRISEAFSAITQLKFVELLSMVLSQSPCLEEWALR